MAHITIALDIDGAFSPITKMNSGLPRPDNRWEDWEYLIAPKSFGACFAEPVVELFKELSTRDNVTVKWHSSWRELAEKLSEELELPEWTQFTDDDSVDNWKVAAVRKWLLFNSCTDNRLIWIDDDIDRFISSKVFPNPEHTNPRLTKICPDSNKGISPDDLKLIKQLTGGVS